MTQTKVGIFDGDPKVVRNAFAQFPSGVAVLAADVDGSKHALVASSFMVGVSLDPCLSAVAVQKSSETWKVLKDAAMMGVSILGKGQVELSRKLASKNRAARFEQVAIEVGDRGAIFIDGAALWLQCFIHDFSEAGDHWMVLLEVNELGIGNHEPLVWHDAKFRELVDARTIDVE
ncbi:flavin reductase family protein [Rhodococcus sp. 14C212]|uniref:flavin reductase family protein n=1 Tax=Rhodococcus sp. 14C212 TaxID=2711209 RepID=UPI0013ED9E3B|nr:flavin reductase family protein [Rhodococcus sp. 14C212]NGP08328.1 flavin reductase family protein [Rhodococcus sp. 14C212]